MSQSLEQELPPVVRMVSNLVEYQEYFGLYQIRLHQYYSCLNELHQICQEDESLTQERSRVIERLQRLGIIFHHEFNPNYNPIADSKRPRRATYR